MMIIKAKLDDILEKEKDWKIINFTGNDFAGDKKYFAFGGNIYARNTICRATNLEDSKGNLIFENDRLKPADYVPPEFLDDAALEEVANPEKQFSNPVVRWVPERSAFYLVSERIIQTAPQIINTGKDIHADYEVDHIRTVRFVALTKEEARRWIVYGNTIDNPDDSDYRVLPPKDADDFSSDS